MPELAEVERARSLLESVALGRTITSVVAAEDDLVFSDGARQKLIDGLPGRKVTAVKRKAKYFYPELDGEGPVPLIHFGMSGACAIKGGEPMYYRKKPKDDDQWPPKYWRMTLIFDDGGEWACMDSRRFGRIKSIEGDPLTQPPLSLLGRDPLYDMPSVEELQKELCTRSSPIKAFLLDQNAFICGLGNWLVDEILFHARIHPSQPCFTLSTGGVKSVHDQIVAVVTTAVACNADHNKFPEGWLFMHRWSKGKKGVPLSFTMADGQKTSIKFETVGGRTSAITDVQKLFKSDAALSPRKRKLAVVSVEENSEVTPTKTKRRKKIVVKEEMSKDGDESDLTALSEDEEIVEKPTPTRSRRRKEES